MYREHLSAAVSRHDDETAERGVARPETDLRTALGLLFDFAVRRLTDGPAEPPLPERLWTVGQLSEWLQIPETTLLEYARDGKIPSVRVGKHVRFDPHAVLKALAAKA